MFAFDNATKSFNADVTRSDLFNSVLESIDLTSDEDQATRKLIFSVQKKDNGETQVTIARPHWKKNVLTAGKICQGYHRLTKLSSSASSRLKTVNVEMPWFEIHH